MPIVVHELSPRAAADPAPALFNRRAKIWRQLVPPDQLSAAGHADGGLAAFMPTAGRASVRKGARAAGGPLSIDPRAGFLPLPLPPPGDPGLDGALEPRELTWSIVADASALVQAVVLDEGAPPVFGFVVREAARAGSISVARCEALGVPQGDAYRRLKDGEAVENAAGAMVPPELVVAPPKPGRVVRRSRGVGWGSQAGVVWFGSMRRAAFLRTHFLSLSLSHTHTHSDLASV